MRLSSTWLVVAAAALIACGNASTTTESHHLNALHGGDRMLRGIDENKGIEERGPSWADLIKAFTLTDADIQAITVNAGRFKRWDGKDREALDVTKRMIRKGASEVEAVKWAARYEEYLKNPSKYH